MRLYPSLAAIAVALLSFALVACDGDDRPAQPNDDSSAEASASSTSGSGIGSRSTSSSTAGASATGSPPGDSSPTATGSPGASATPASSPGASATPGDVGTLRDAVKDYSKSNYRVVYQVTARSTSGDQSLRYSTSNAPPNSAVLIEDLGEKETYRSIRDAGYNYFCIDSEKLCFKSKLTEEDLAEDILPTVNAGDVVDQAEADGASATEIGGRQIAGRDARCWDITDPSGSGQLCLDRETGITLFVEGNFDGDDSRFEATEFSTSPDTALFVVPADYEITDLDDTGSDTGSDAGG